MGGSYVSDLIELLVLPNGSGEGMSWCMAQSQLGGDAIYSYGKLCQYIYTVYIYI